MVLVTMFSLVSVRDKEVVIRVPGGTDVAELHASDSDWLGEYFPSKKPHKKTQKSKYVRRPKHKALYDSNVPNDKDDFIKKGTDATLEFSPPLSDAKKSSPGATLASTITSSAISEEPTLYALGSGFGTTSSGGSNGGNGGSVQSTGSVALAGPPAPGPPAPLGTLSPIITAIIPSSGASGSTVFIQGTDFSTNPVDNTVEFGLIQANSSVISSNRLQTIVPNGLSPGFSDVSVTADTNTSNLLQFNVLQGVSGQVFEEEGATRIPQSVIINNFRDFEFKDVDRDGDLDILVVDNSGALILLDNNGSGAFSDVSATQLPALSNIETISDIHLGDIENDGDLDILIVNEQDEQIRILVNNAGSFANETASRLPIMTPIASSASLTLGDIDGDGYLDIIVANTDYEDDLFLNDGTGVFTLDAGFVLPSSIDDSTTITLGDIDRDGDLDIFTTTYNDRNRIYVNDGTGTFSDETTTRLPAYSDTSKDAEFGDIDGDNYIDLVVSNEQESTLFINNTFGNFLDQSTTNLPTDTFNSEDAEFGDIDGDGDLDIVLIGTAESAIYLNDGLGFFEDRSIMLPPYDGTNVIGGFDVELGDIDGDGDLDIIVGGNSQGAILISNASNKAPILESIGAKTVEPNTLLSFNVTALDPNDDALTYLATNLAGGNLPSGATFDAGGNQLFSWMPTVGQTGIYDIRFEVDDGEFADQEDITITVGSNTPPTLTVSPSSSDLTIFKGDSDIFYATATDAEGNLPITISWVVNGNPIGSAIDDFSMMSVIFGTGDHEIVVTATDSEGASSTFTWTVHVDEGSAQENAPVIDTKTPVNSTVNITVQPGGTATQQFAVTAYHDPDGDNVDFSWFKKPAGGSYQEITLLQGQASGFLGLTPGEFYIKVTLTDDSAQALSTSFEWHVTITEGASPARPPVIDTKTPVNSTVNITVQPGGTATQEFAVTAYHDPDGDNVDFSWFKKPVGGSYQEIIALQGQTSGFLGLTPGEFYIKVTLTDDSAQALSASFEWYVTIAESPLSAEPPVIDAKSPTNSAVDVTVPPAGSVFQDFAVTAYHDPDGDNVSFTWFEKPSGGVYQEIIALQGQENGSVEFTTDGESYIKVVLTDDSTQALFTSFEWHITATLGIDDQVVEDILETTFPYFWFETDNPSTGFIRDRLAVDPAGRNSGYDSGYEKASMAATGFGLASLCVAAERYGDGSDPNWPILPEDLMERAELIIDKLLEIQANQAVDETIWGKDGFFYHFVNINTGQRWTTSEVSTIDTALLISGVLTAGEYFKNIDTDPIGDPANIREKALQVYKNVNWKAFLDEDETVINAYIVANPNYNQMYHAWSPEQEFFGHWDYTSECHILYLLATASPEVNHAIPPETFYSFRRELGKYGGTDARPMVKSWFGPLFVYQYTQAFFNFKDANGDPLYDKQMVDWWENSVEATKANKEFCNDNIANYANEENLWGLTSCYDTGFNYRMYGAPPSAVSIPSQDVYGANGTVAPAAAAGSLPMLPTETILALDKMKELYDIYGHPIWGDYGFVNSFKLGATLSDTPDPISDFYVGIDMGVTLVMAENYKTDLIWNAFGNFEVEAGVTLKNKIIDAIGFTSDQTSIVTLDDIDPSAGFSTGLLDSDNTTHDVEFNLTSIENKPYLVAIHSFVDIADLGTHEVDLNISLNGTSHPSNPIRFIYTEGDNESAFIKYIELDHTLLINGQNTMTIEWLPTSQSWFAWENIEISTPVQNDTWSIVRNYIAIPRVLFGNEYRVDDTYYLGNDVSTFQQAINKDVQNFVDILFYTENTEYGVLTINVLETDSAQASNLTVFVNDLASPVFDGQISDLGLKIEAIPLAEGWNRITLFHPGASGGATAEWLRWSSVVLTEGSSIGLDIPESVVGASFGKDENRLRWQRVDGATRYKIYRSIISGDIGTLIDTVNAPTTVYFDNNKGVGLNNGITYYYTLKAADGSSESENSEQIGVRTGPYQLDYGDGYDPNVFGGYTLNNFGGLMGDAAYTEMDRYNNETGKVRKFVLSPSQKNTIRLNNADISDSSIVSFRIFSEASGAKFRLKLIDGALEEAMLSIESSAAGMWQEMHFLLNEISGFLDFSNLVSLEVISETTGQAITLYMDDIEFSTVELGTDFIDAHLRNRSDDVIATSLSFGVHAMGTTNVLSNQYIDILYQCTGDWSIHIYTDNKSEYAVPKFTGSGNKANGLVGLRNSGYRIPMLWQVFQNLQYTTPGTEPDWTNFKQVAYVVDKSDDDFWGPPGQGHGPGNPNRYTLGYRTIFDNEAKLGYPISHDNQQRTGVIGANLYVYVGTNFYGVPAQTYTSNMFTVEIYHE